jgi:hypothetical protein
MRRDDRREGDKWIGKQEKRSKDRREDGENWGREGRRKKRVDVEVDTQNSILKMIQKASEAKQYTAGNRDHMVNPLSPWKCILSILDGKSSTMSLQILTSAPNTVSISKLFFEHNCMLYFDSQSYRCRDATK